MPLLFASLMNGVPRLDGEPEIEAPPDADTVVSTVPAAFFRTTGMRLLAGRGFVEGEEGVAVVSGSFAGKHGGTVIGRAVYLPRGRKGYPIVGVVNDVPYNGLADESVDLQAVYIAGKEHAKAAEAFVRFIVRTDGDPLDVISGARLALARIDPEVPILQPQTGPQAIGRQTAQHRFVAMLLGGLAALGFVLAMSGVYGAVALNVLRRRREIGLRMALGAASDALADSLTGTLTYVWDGLDRLTSETSAAGSISYTYDRAGRRETMTVAGQLTVNYTYDDADRLKQITQGSSIVTLDYDAANRRTVLGLPNGVSVHYGYDAANQLTGLTYKSSATVLGTLTYEYDSNGRRTVVGGTFARTRLPLPLASATYNAANQLTAWDGVNFTYDENGNLRSEGGRTYAWDARNQLAAIGGGVTASFKYDALGRRMSKTIGTASTEYLYDGATTVQELSGGSPAANLLVGPGPDEVLLRSDAAGSRLVLADALGSTLALLDASGVVRTQYTYDPFGSSTTAGESNANSAQFTGRENDLNGLYYYRARYLSPVSQRFISEDPVGFSGGDVNLYSYVGNDPANAVDPSGLTYSSNWNFLWRWATGLHLQPIRIYRDGSIEAQEMARSAGVDDLRRQFYAGNCQDIRRGQYGTVRAYIDTVADPRQADWSSTAAQVGGFALGSIKNNGNGTMTFLIPNKAGAHSFFLHAVNDSPLPFGPFSNIYQFFTWTEPINGRK